jgi:hypothetical protein
LYHTWSQPWLIGRCRQSPTPARRTVAARIERCIDQFGRPAYDIMVADCIWHIYHLLGQLSARVNLLSRT